MVKNNFTQGYQMTLPKAIICDIDGTLADHRHRLHFVDAKSAGCISALKSADYGKNGKLVTSRSYWVERQSKKEFIPNWDAFYKAMGHDGVNEAACEILFGLSNLECRSEIGSFDYEFLFVTGRPEKYRKATDDWLSRKIPGHIYDLHKLFLRPDFLPCDGKLCGRRYPEAYNSNPFSRCDVCDLKPDHRQSHVVKREIFEREIGGQYDVLFALEDSDDCISMYNSLRITCLKLYFP